MELLRLFVLSRCCDSTNVLTGLMAVNARLFCRFTETRLKKRVVNTSPAQRHPKVPQDLISPNHPVCRVVGPAWRMIR